MLMNRSATSVGLLVEMRLAKETVQPVQFDAAIQMMGGPPPVARAFSRVPSKDPLSPKVAADPTQYFKKSRLVTFTLRSFSWVKSDSKCCLDAVPDDSGS